MTVVWSELVFVYVFTDWPWRQLRDPDTDIARDSYCAYTTDELYSESGVRCMSKRFPAKHFNMPEMSIKWMLFNEQVLLQGCVVTSENVHSILDLVQRGLDTLECRLAESFQHVLATVLPGSDCDVSSANIVAWQILCRFRNDLLSFITRRSNSFTV